MKDKKILYGIIVAFVFLASIGFTYAYFSITAQVQGEAKVIETSVGQLTLRYTDGPEIKAERIEPDWTASKTITVTNNGTLDAYYKIDWLRLTNTITRNELVMTVTCIQKLNNIETGTCEGIESTPVPANNSGNNKTMKGNISIQEGYTHEYTFTFRFIETGSEQNYNQGQNFNGVINVNGDGPLLSLKNVILSAETPISDEGIAFNQISSNTNGKGLYYTSNLNMTENSERVYYYRGEVTNNNVIFGNYCWKIIRTVEDGSVKMIYNGEKSNNTCPVKGSQVNLYVSYSTFNDDPMDNRHLGYMYGESCGTYAQCHDNTTPSTAKSALESWYTSNLNSLSSYIADTPYCNDRTVSLADTIMGEANEKTGASYDTTFYNAAQRFIDASSQTASSSSTPTYKCTRSDDKFTVSNTLGNGENTKAIGLITADEAVFAGLVFNQNNSNNYLTTNSTIWTMTPMAHNGDSMGFLISGSGQLTFDRVDVTGLIPVISLNDTAIVDHGEGTNLEPYVIDIN